MEGKILSQIRNWLVSRIRIPNSWFSIRGSGSVINNFVSGTLQCQMSSIDIAKTDLHLVSLFSFSSPPYSEYARESVVHISKVDLRLHSIFFTFLHRSDLLLKVQKLIQKLRTYISGTHYHGLSIDTTLSPFWTNVKKKKPNVQYTSSVFHFLFMNVSS